MYSYLLLAVLLFHASTFPQSSQVEVEIVISNIKSPKGEFVISFYDTPDHFPKVGKEVQIEKVLVRDTLPHLVKVKVPKEGWYAVAMFQDEDENGKIRQDKIGVPEEAYAFSNNVHPKIEAPSFSSCKFYASKTNEKPQAIRLIQPRFHGRL